MDTIRENKTKNAVYKVGSIIPEDGLYICVPCGNKKYLKAGAHFENCLKCLGKDWRLFRRGLELWEKIHEEK